MRFPLSSALLMPCSRGAGQAARGALPAGVLRARMLPRTLRQNQDQGDDHGRKQSGRRRPIQVQTTLGQRLVDEVPDGSAKWAGEDERGPEQEDVAHLLAEVEDREDGKSGAENQRAAGIAEAPAAVARRISRPVAER